MKSFNKKYWDKFYKKKKLTVSPSKFSKFVLKKIKNKSLIIYDLGSGNGRDTIFFKKNKINCFGLERSKIGIKETKKKYKKYAKNFINTDFCKFFKNKKIKSEFGLYSRFTLHTINYANEKLFFQAIKKQKKLKYVFIETRTIQDDYYGIGEKVGKHEFISSHYRRFIDPKEIKKKLQKFLKIIYFKKSKNFAKFKKENPMILRIIAKKI